jgi:hypothetical protein
MVMYSEHGQVPRTVIGSSEVDAGFRLELAIAIGRETVVIAIWQGWCLSMQKSRELGTIGPSYTLQPSHMDSIL